ncbi:MAG: hypothetical protein J3K34DRAFT_433945 [Monoraphidium minutum]|nr:MAG: hypothetical protein J3K34DRAFT_433945 [Monoraphidium minutum]
MAAPPRRGVACLNLKLTGCTGRMTEATAATACDLLLYIPAPLPPMLNLCVVCQMPLPGWPATQPSVAPLLARARLSETAPQPGGRRRGFAASPLPPTPPGGVNDGAASWALAQRRPELGCVAEAGLSSAGREGGHGVRTAPVGGCRGHKALRGATRLHRCPAYSSKHWSKIVPD